jgi:hypothetical protein
MIKSLQLIILASIFLGLYSCDDAVPKEEVVTGESQDTTSVIAPEIAEFEFFNIIANMPTPLEELGDMNNDKIAFDASLLAPLENAVKHESNDAMAINCGIYIVDMTYQAVYHKNKDIINFTETVHQLAEKIDAVQIFDEAVSDNMKSRIEDKDSLKLVIGNGLASMENYLVENKRLATATQLLTGSWIEVQYILTQSMLKLSDPAKDLKQHVFSQRVHLDNLLVLLHEFKDEAGLHEELEKLNQLEASFTKIHEAEEVSHDILLEVANEIKEIRNDFLGM